MSRMWQVGPEVYGVDGDAAQVVAWSTRRLPFEPRGPMHAYRTALRTALRRLVAVPGEGLIATYLSPAHSTTTTVRPTTN